jgi:hypothetical protein
LKKRKLVQSASKDCVRFGPLGFQPCTDAHSAVHTLPLLVALAARVARPPFVLAVGFCKDTERVVSLSVENSKERGHGFLEGSPYMHRLASDHNLLATIRRNADNLS